jgi:hypothetical protein
LTITRDTLTAHSEQDHILRRRLQVIVD